MAWRWLVLPLALTLGVSIACTHEETKVVDVPADDDDDTTADAGPALSDLQLRPAEMYSGFDGTHSFKAPFAVYNAGDDVEVTATPANAVTLTPVTLAAPEGDKGKYYFAEAKAAGDVTLTVKSKGQTASHTLHITNYDPARWTAGQTRYTTGVDGTHPPCTDCHVNGQAIDHSPSALVSVTDEKVGLIMSTGLSTANFPISVDKTTYPNGHKWTSGAGPEQDGLITYLRALEPKGFK